MTRYVDVAVVRIQSYLTRAPSLKGRRGASTMVTEASAAARELLPDGFEVNPEAGTVDGVLSVRARTDTGKDHRVEIADAMCSRLRAALPAATLRVTLWTGDSYSAARATSHPDRTYDWLPAVAEWPLAKPCDWCRAWPALQRPHTPTGGDRDEHYCRDCTRRLGAAGASTSPHRAPGPERELVRRLGGGTVPDTMEDLAALGPPGDATHLATICADGNRIGDYMAAHAHTPALADAITESTWTAVTSAARATTTAAATWGTTARGVASGGAVTPAAAPPVAPGPESGSPVPLIAHLVGGDVDQNKVPAHRAWPTVHQLLTGFGADLPPTGRHGSGPSLSAGVVIHHRAEPLADIVDLGHARLRTAKDTQPGRAAFAWHSVTHDGALPSPRPALALSDLSAHRDALATLAELPAAARQQLARLCREDPGSLARHVARLRLGPVVAPFTPDTISLEDALSMVRWWTP